MSLLVFLQKKNFESTIKKIMPIYFIVVAITILLISIFVNIFLGLFLLVVLGLFGLLFYHLISKL